MHADLLASINCELLNRANDVLFDCLFKPLSLVDEAAKGGTKYSFNCK